MSKARKRPAPRAESRPAPAAAAASAPNLADRVAGPAPIAGGNLQAGRAEVAHSEEAGGYYCEHMLYSTLEQASQPGSSVVEGDGGRLAGFLHLPDDAETYQSAEVTDQSRRHARTRDVVGAALRGYFDQISLRGGVSDHDPYRILLTGYGSFMDSIQNNPTGDFVAHEENVTAAMQQAFGARLVSGPEAVNVAQTDRFLQRARAGGGAEVAEYYNATWRFVVEEPATCGTREVLVTALRLPVTDQAIDPSAPGSVQDAMAEFGPHAVLSMGVVPDNDFSTNVYRAETRADDENLASDQNRRQHTWGQAATREHRSAALANAIRDGAPHVGRASP